MVGGGSNRGRARAPCGERAPRQRHRPARPPRSGSIWYTRRVREVVVGVLAGMLIATACDRSESDPEPERGAAAARGQVDANARVGGDATPKTSERGSGRGLADRLREVVSGDDPARGERKGVAISAEIPPGEMLIVHECGHSMQPFGTEYWHETRTVDLAEATVVVERVEGDGSTEKPPPATSAEKRSKSLATLTPADVARIRGALDEVLGGGPYAPVYAVPEGIVCTLSLRVGDDPPFFRIDKSRNEGEDAVTRLIASLGPSASP